MSYLKDREIWLSNVPTGNPPAGYFWKFIQNGKVVVRDSSGNNQMMIATSGSQAITGSLTVTEGITGTVSSASYVEYSGVANKPTLVSGSSQITYSGLTGIPSGIISGSAQLPSGLISGSSQLPSGIISSSVQVTGFGFATTGSNAFIGTQTITGSLYISSDLVVQGSSSLQDITASAVNIGANIVNLNTANPAIRFAGLNIFDSGSIGGSGSFLYDAVQDEFIFVHRGDNANITSSVVLMGPQTYNNIGSETYPTANRILKGVGNEHIGDSIISETGGGIGISGSLSITGSLNIGTTSNATRVLQVQQPSGYDSAVRLMASTGGSALLEFLGDGASTQPTIGVTSALPNNLTIGVGGSTVLTINPTGSIGIATSNLNWNDSSLTALQIRDASIYGYSNYELGIQVGAYYTNAWKYQSTGVRPWQIQLGNDNAIKFQTAVTGSTNGTISWSEVMRITSGSVGIGTTTPIGMLHVYSNNQNVASSLSTAYTNAKFRLEPFNTSGVGVSMGLISPNVNYLQSHYSDLTSTAPYVINPYGGNVGIGVTTPGSNMLSIGGSASSNFRLAVENNVTGTTGTNSLANFTNQSDADLQISTTKVGVASKYAQISPSVSGLPIVIGVNSNNVGVGVIPSAWASGTTALQVGTTGGLWNRASDGLTVLASNSYFNGSVDKQITTGFSNRMYFVNGAVNFDRAESTAAGSNTPWVTTMTLKSDGTLQLGPQNSTVTATLAVSRDGAWPGDVSPVHMALAGVSDSRKRLVLGYDTTNNYGYIASGQWGVQWTSLYLQQSGGALYGGSARLDNNSDIRIKDNIQPIIGALDKVLSMTGKKFHLLDEPEEKIRLGFIAQDLQGVVDELVIESDRKQKLPSGEIVENILGLETWGSSWAAILVEAIKEQQEQIEILKSRIEILEQ